MRIEALADSPIGTLVPIVGPDPATQEIRNGLAFLPDSLPRDVQLSTVTWTTVNKATAALARLDGAARLIPRPALLRRPTLRREAQSTSALEKSQAGSTRPTAPLPVSACCTRAWTCRWTG